MAFPTVSAPYGLQPINLIGGQQFAGQTRELPITAANATVNYNTALYNGDVVQISTNGTIIKSTLAAQTSAVAGVVGVFVGCSYTNPTTRQKVFAQYWPGFASGVTDALAYVVDDPDALFKVVVCGDTADGTGLVPVPVTQAYVGGNLALVLNAGNANTGNSRLAATSPADPAALAALRIVDVVNETGFLNSSNVLVYPEVVAKFNFGYHSYYNATGLA
jgi:hypothetical protein